MLCVALSALGMPASQRAVIKNVADIFCNAWVPMSLAWNEVVSLDCAVQGPMAGMTAVWRVLSSNVAMLRQVNSTEMQGLKG